MKLEVEVELRLDDLQLEKVLELTKALQQTRLEVSRLRKELKQ